MSRLASLRERPLIPAWLWSRWSGVLLLAVVLLAAPAVLPSVYVGLLSRVLILGIFAMSLDLLLGYCGLPSLGHATFFGVAGYTVALLALRGVESVALLLAAGMLAAVATGALFGLLALRTHGAYFLMITLAINEVVWGLAYKMRFITGGVNGLAGIPRPELWLPWALDGERNYYYLVLLLFAAAAAAMGVLVRSPMGLAFRAVRESESRMEALGYHVWWCKYLALLVSALFAGLAGMLLVFYNGYVSPADISVIVSAKVLLMVILGGAGTLWGPLVGAAVIVVLENEISSLTDRWFLVLGVMYVAVALLAPHGVFRYLQRGLRAVAPSRGGEGS